MESIFMGWGKKAAKGFHFVLHRYIARDPNIEPLHLKGLVENRCERRFCGVSDAE